MDQITRHGNWEYTTWESKSYRSRKGTKEWTLVDQPPAEPQLTPSLVLHAQEPGEPDHWSFFVAHEGGTGTEYQVKGDAELMHHTYAEGVNIQNAASFKTAYTRANLSQVQAELVAYYANQEAPPSAPDRASVRENCQGWAVRVLEKPKGQNIVTEEWLENAKSMLEPV